ncbi:hypothetical protein RhiirA5_412115 [Rhizophagus irregularis]|uniref:Uncharacterized protein n=1 Tax=Rhizophagus irregularis TaxID=588596 RepID=A0A2N0PZD0_9GLOM|nr:hypothetical protein RhiirA5_412115 [Rhizophagus irregularis]
MSDIESMSSDCSDSDLFTEEFLENIPDDSDLSDNEKSRDRHPKGRLPENTRFKRPLETSNDSNKITNGRLKTNVVVVIIKDIIMLLVHQITVKRKERMTNISSNWYVIMSWLALA